MDTHVPAGQVDSYTLRSYDEAGNAHQARRGAQRHPARRLTGHAHAYINTHIDTDGDSDGNDDTHSNSPQADGDD